MPRSTLSQVRRELRALADPKRAEILQWFLKTGPGEYGEGDKCLGIRVPAIRGVARGARELSLTDTLTLLHSRWHEERFLALVLLVDAHARGTAEEQEKIFDAYLANTAYINNWDLVDLSAGPIVGPHLGRNPNARLGTLIRSSNLWERRIGVVATSHFIRKGDFGPTLHVATALLTDTHDLIHKAVGWMLREVGKRDRTVLEAFLRQHHHRMPRTMLRYALEHFPAAERQRFMTKNPQ
jgi:3-methyladenine DNA glycosylase AlkD